MREWKGTWNLICVPLNDFDLILKIDFFLKAKIALIPYLCGFIVLEESQSCFIHALKEKNYGKGQLEMLFSIQLKKGLK